MLNRKGLYALQLATAVISRDSQAISDLAVTLAGEFKEREIKRIWRIAKLPLVKEETLWLKDQLQLLLKYS